MKRLGILLSGRGSNFEAIADNVAAGTHRRRDRGGDLQSCLKRAAWRSPASAA